MKIFYIHFITIRHLLFVSFLFLPFTSGTASEQSDIPVHTAISMKLANFLTPNNNTHYGIVTLSSLRPYTLFRNKPAHEKIRMNYELGIGYAGGEQKGTIISANMLAHRYLTPPSKKFRPFIEGGIGIIYTEFRIPGQGLYLNFNPQIGIGFEHFNKKGNRHFVSLRFSHLSNGELDDDNKGITSIVLSFGHDF